MHRDDPDTVREALRLGRVFPSRDEEVADPRASNPDRLLFQSPDGGDGAVQLDLARGGDASAVVDVLAELLEHIESEREPGRRAADVARVDRIVAEIEERLSELPRVTPAFGIIGGDFNTLNIKWFDSMWPIPFAEHQGRAVREELESAGFGTPFGDTRPTFKFMGLPLKLDWLYLKRLETREVGVDDVPLSDHRGIWTRAALIRSDAESATSNP